MITGAAYSGTWFREQHRCLPRFFSDVAIPLKVFEPLSFATRQEFLDPPSACLATAKLPLPQHRCHDVVKKLPGFCSDLALPLEIN